MTEASPRAEPLEDADVEPAAPSGHSISSSISYSTSPSISTTSVKIRGTTSLVNQLPQQGIRAASTGLIPGSSNDLNASLPQPPPPTLEQNIAYETHISSTQEQTYNVNVDPYPNNTQAGPSSHGKRTSNNAFVTDDEFSDIDRPPNRRRIVEGNGDTAP